MRAYTWAGIRARKGCSGLPQKAWTEATKQSFGRQLQACQRPGKEGYGQ